MPGDERPNSNDAMSKKKIEKPYWLGDGEETCEICGHTILVQAEIHCTGCDAGVCEHCSILLHESHEIVCIPCSRLSEPD
jgi:hypothetical protein